MDESQKWKRKFQSAYVSPDVIHFSRDFLGLFLLLNWLGLKPGFSGLFSGLQERELRAKSSLSRLELTR